MSTAALAASIAVALVLGVGGWRLVQSEPQPRVMLPRREAPHARFDAASFRYGPTLDATSMNHERGSFPSYAIDEAKPSVPLAWMPAPTDPAPALSITFREPTVVDEIVVQLALPAEPLPTTALDVSCLLGTTTVHHESRLPGAEREHLPLPSVRCDSIRVQVTPNTPVYEIEAWGTLP